jgi:putative heme-binding domain-containing protein
MTHCRSRWGKGLTTHVVQGGHYWNQVNSGHAPFISATALPHQPAMRNYMLASARYGHGEGGAGKQGSREVYGGHSHVGTMIYLGDNWPDQFRNHLFTHNLRGHQINHQVNHREAGGFNTLHAGHDMLFCADQQYIGIDLKYGPDGAVYISDWYDPRHCHNPNVEQWDRGNGRLYRMKYDATYKPTLVDFTTASDAALVEAQLHKNDWNVRTARRVLSERSANGRISENAIQRLRTLALTHAEPARRLRAVWALHAVGAIDAELAAKLLKDESEYVRGWTVQLAVEALEPRLLDDLLKSLAKRETSLFVRRYLASAIQRVPSDLGWELVERLSMQPENASDRELPLLLWYGLAGLMPQHLGRAFALAEATQVPVLSDYIQWYAAKLSHEGRDEIIKRLTIAESDEQFRLLSLLELGVRGMRGLPQPKGWSDIATRLYGSSDVRTQRAAESFGAAFGDVVLFGRMRDSLADQTSNLNAKRHAVSILARDPSPENLRLFLALLNTRELVPQVLPLLTRYNNPAVAKELIARLPQWQGRENAAAMEVLSSRVAWAGKVLDSIATGDLKKKQLTAYHVRQMTNLANAGLNSRLSKEWGVLKQSSAERRADIAAMVEVYTSAPLWAYSAGNGSIHFKKLCTACHQPNQQDESLGPKLAGTRSKGIGYLVENLIDPNAVIGRDFQARIIVTLDGRVINGLVEKETKSALTIRTATNSVTVARDRSTRSWSRRTPSCPKDC